jgi:hypothetical protein
MTICARPQQPARQARRTQPWDEVCVAPRSLPLTIMMGGRCFSGQYAVQSEMLTVWNREFGSRTAQIGEHDVPTLARALLLEIERECRLRTLHVGGRAA